RQVVRWGEHRSPRRAGRPRAQQAEEKGSRQVARVIIEPALVQGIHPVTDRLAIARESARAALQVRRSLVIARERPLNPFDVAQALGIEVWFTDAPSLEGMFARSDDARIV